MLITFRIHVQGADDQVVPPSMMDYVRRVLPAAMVHRLAGEGHFSYFCFCDECHRHVLSAVFGIPQGPHDDMAEDQTVSVCLPVDETTDSLDSDLK